MTTRGQYIQETKTETKNSSESNLAVETSFDKLNTSSSNLFKGIHICPGCGYDMGMRWMSQYCSRKCMFSRIRYNSSYSNP